MIILFGNKKGGVGKSITAINLAGAIIAKAKRRGTLTKTTVCIVDADTNESVVNYIRRRETYSQELVKQGLEELPFIKCELRKPDDTLTRDLKALNELYDYVLVDTGGYENRAFKSSVPVSDMIYLPFQPSQVDLEQLIPTLFVIKQIEENVQDGVDPDFKVDPRLLLTMVDHTSRDLFQEAKRVCVQLLSYASISGVAIPLVKAIKKIQDKGLTLSDSIAGTGEYKYNAHAKRAQFDLLLDEIDGIREVEFKRENQMVSDTSDTAC
ncbi:ParA family protein [Thalassomonas viridans]|uniref:ParA family protein n=1 Tax=Thalassomonas viridans TaxID=137584 RepID=A0AAE9ZB62_9GAMM|nr:ParA family protein [Thalassomonas viridans]WDE09159.1 ParA family protein [Thalassomonas viridans]